MPREWRPVAGTRNWILVDEDTAMALRHIAVRDPYLGDPGGTKYDVTGDGHEPAPDAYPSLAEAKAAAERSLPGAS